jgi:hypothetical protein
MAQLRPRQVSPVKEVNLRLVLACVLLGGCGGSSGERSASKHNSGAGGAGGASTSAAKEPGFVDAPCTHYAEGLPTFGSFSANMREVDNGNSDCKTDACLVVGFVGRKSCPAGRTEGGVASGTGSCETQEGEAVTVVVAPQIEPTKVDRHVFCSCRCDAAADSPCTCPSDMGCVQVLSERDALDERRVVLHVPGQLAVSAGVGVSRRTLEESRALPTRLKSPSPDL